MAKKRAPLRKTIALIAHDGKKAELIAFIKDHMEFFRGFNLVATATTGTHVQRAGLKVKKSCRARWAATRRSRPSWPRASVRR